MIYAVSIMDGKYVKIGFSKYENSEKRISELQTGSPFKIVEMFTIDGNLKQEQELHKCLTEAFTRIRIPIPPNEWYPARNNFFVEFLSNLRISANSGISFCDKYHQSIKQPGRGITSLEPNFKWAVK